MLERLPNLWVARRRLDSRASNVSASLGATVSKFSEVSVVMDFPSLFITRPFYHMFETDAMVETLETRVGDCLVEQKGKYLICKWKWKPMASVEDLSWTARIPLQVTGSLRTLPHSKELHSARRFDTYWAKRSASSASPFSGRTPPHSAAGTAAPSKTGTDAPKVFAQQDFNGTII